MHQPPIDRCGKYRIFQLYLTDLFTGHISDWHFHRFASVSAAGRS
jgi:hypothetical protein